jgi:hypothetical protein
MEADSLTLGRGFMLQRCLLDDEVVHELLLLLKHYRVRVLVNA